MQLVIYLTFEALKTPVLFLIFSRPDTTQRVFEEIRKARPAKLYVAADGPREAKKEESEKCRQTRAIINQVDWDCEVKTLYRDKNLGCRMAVSSAIDWFFEQEEEGIILEDDCLPHPDFFVFCTTLLEKYRYDSRVMHISGSNLQFGKVFGEGSYYFSKHVNIWGWASWRRAWQYYDVEISSFPRFIEQKQIHNVLFFHNNTRRYLRILHKIYQGADTWDFQWAYGVFTQNGLAITPNVNLVSNIGFGEESTHAFDSKNKMANIPVKPIGQIKHPAFVLHQNEADSRFTRITLRPLPLLNRIRKKLKKMLA